MTGSELHDSYFSGLVLGTMVSVLRGRHQMSQTDLAQRLGLNQTSISRLERGQMDPEDTCLGRLAQALQLTPRAFTQLREDAMARIAAAVQATMVQAQGPAWKETALERVGYLGLAGLTIYVVSAVLAEFPPQPSKAQASSTGRALRIHGRSARPGPRYSL